MTTTPASRLSEIINGGMAKAFSGSTRSREQQVVEAVAGILATKPSLYEVADARLAVLERHHANSQHLARLGDEGGLGWSLRTRAKQVEALSIAEATLRDVRA